MTAKTRLRPRRISGSESSSGPSSLRNATYAAVRFSSAQRSSVTSEYGRPASASSRRSARSTRSRNAWSIDVEATRCANDWKTNLRVESCLPFDFLRMGLSDLPLLRFMLEHGRSTGSLRRQEKWLRRRLQSISRAGRSRATRKSMILLALSYALRRLPPARRSPTARRTPRRAAVRLDAGQIVEVVSGGAIQPREPARQRAGAAGPHFFEGWSTMASDPQRRRRRHLRPRRLVHHRRPRGRPPSSLSERRRRRTRPRAAGVGRAWDDYD